MVRESIHSTFSIRNEATAIPHPNGSTILNGSKVDLVDKLEQHAVIRGERALGVGVAGKYNQPDAVIDTAIDEFLNFLLGDVETVVRFEILGLGTTTNTLVNDLELGHPEVLDEPVRGRKLILDEDLTIGLIDVDRGTTDGPLRRGPLHEDIHIPVRACLRQHAVIRNLVIKPAAQETHVIQPFCDNPHQLPLAGYITKNNRNIIFMITAGSTDSFPLYP